MRSNFCILVRHDVINSHVWHSTVSQKNKWFSDMHRFILPISIIFYKKWSIRIQMAANQNSYISPNLRFLIINKSFTSQLWIFANRGKRWSVITELAVSSKDLPLKFRPFPAPFRTKKDKKVRKWMNVTNKIVDKFTEVKWELGLKENKSANAAK